MRDEILEKIDLEQVVQRLPVKHRVVMALIAAGFSHSDTAAIVGVTRAAVGIKIKKTVEILRSTYHA